MKKTCRQCGQEMQGRTDKKFCSTDCKNRYHIETRHATRDAVIEIDGYLHRNREILALLMGNAMKIEIDRLVLSRTGFRYEYHTGTYLNKEGKTYHLVYDFAWMDFSAQKMLIVRKKRPWLLKNLMVHTFTINQFHLHHAPTQQNSPHHRR